MLKQTLLVTVALLCSACVGGQYNPSSERGSEMYNASLDQSECQNALNEKVTLLDTKSDELSNRFTSHVDHFTDLWVKEINDVTYARQARCTMVVSGNPVDYAVLTILFDQQDVAQVKTLHMSISSCPIKGMLRHGNIIVSEHTQEDWGERLEGTRRTTGAGVYVDCESDRGYDHIEASREVKRAVFTDVIPNRKIPTPN